MKKIDINDTGFDYISTMTNNKKELGRLPLHSNIVDSYVLFISYFPFDSKKLKIYKKLRKGEKLGMLNRHILSVAKKLDISDVLLKKIHDHTQKYKIFKDHNDSVFYKNIIENTTKEISKGYLLLMEMIIEELKKRNDIKYLRKKKINNILNNSE